VNVTAQIPDGSVIITPTEVYKETLATHQAVQVMSGKLDTILNSQGDHETRIRSLERRLWIGLGVAITLSPIASALVATAVTHH
jgi:hypothetical protein